jgi:hypothetical protein
MLIYSFKTVHKLWLYLDLEAVNYLIKPYPEPQNWRKTNFRKNLPVTSKNILMSQNSHKEKKETNKKRNPIVVKKLAISYYFQTEHITSENAYSTTA